MAKLILTSLTVYYKNIYSYTNRSIKISIASVAKIEKE